MKILEYFWIAFIAIEKQLFLAGYCEGGVSCMVLPDQNLLLTLAVPARAEPPVMRWVLGRTAACGGWRLECICRAPSVGPCPGLTPHSLRGSCQVAHGFRSVSSPSRPRALIADLRPESSSSGAAPRPPWLGGWNRRGGPAGLCCRVQFPRPGLSGAAFRGWVVGPVSTASQTVLGKLVTEGHEVLLCWG